MGPERYRTNVGETMNYTGHGTIHGTRTPGKWKVK